MVMPPTNPEPTGYDQQTTVDKLTNIQDINQEGYNAVKQISEGLTLNDSVENTLHSGHLSPKSQMGVKLLLHKEFERAKMLGESLDDDHFKLFNGVKTMGGKMAILEIKTSNSLEGTYSDNLISGVTGQVVRSIKKFLGQKDDK